ncbi:AlbA family DNA-binding domain-containing protein [Promicromonospora sp. CA-289599]|uniref:AlbA family DNA-binding domain-containing protein n=1 Tax=Promicromonospora sp. CA-289599 TaxID=3240014 RepID=UPI003D8D2782
MSSDFPKDVAAMANSGGGTIVFGVSEVQKAATSRRDVGELTERHERALRSAAVTAIMPPIFGLEIHRVGVEGERAVVVVVPPSVDGPHLIYKNDLFGAPIRNDSDTVWMKERQIEAMYRARLDERRHAGEALGKLHDDTAAGHDLQERAWFIGVAHPRIPDIAAARPTREQARETFERAAALGWSDSTGIHPLASVSLNNPRPGLRRWIAPNKATSDRQRFRQAWASIHHDGSVGLASAVGGPPMTAEDGSLPGGRVLSRSIEAAVSDLVALIEAVAERRGGAWEYEVRVGVEYRGTDPMVIQTTDQHGFTYDENSTPLARFTPVAATIVVGEGVTDLHQQVYGLAEDCVNQGGITYLRTIKEPPPSE